MCINRNYRIRHKILKSLQEKLNLIGNNEYLNIEEIELSLNEVSRNTGISELKIGENTDFLSEINEINQEWINGERRMSITRKGTISYFNKNHINNGKKEFWNNAYDIVKTISAIILLCIALITFINNIIDTRQNKNEINKLKTELEQVKIKIKKENIIGAENQLKKQGETEKPIK